ncbi:TATA box-binding protein-associated factor RNA polymerase I subunit A isoform X3 [Pristis pectinata]|uniref:TATA box-binding protein-associated factor RNA polymerase I subunit A isoform X3 n=1 Tax=Pristis pectinata TaxID=685728 RepID=UPI00223C9281|nr:TATA box-binding protein-associated factor RNA polymerase I subunit A isoform X3 [Pristis pectinata]
MDDEIEKLMVGRDHSLDVERAWTSSSLPEVHLHLPTSVLQYQNLKDRKQSGFQRTAKICLRQIRKAVLHHDWQTAAELMTNYFQILEDTSPRNQRSACKAIWRMGTTILQHHPNSSMDNIESFTRKMKIIGVKFYLKACLEHAIHLLCNGKMDEAYRELSVAETWRYGEKSANQQEVLKLIQGYRALLDYYTWAKKNRVVHDMANDAVDSSTAQEMHKYFRQASIGLRDVVQSPGVWDPFILGYVNVLYHLTPSHELMLEFNSLLLKSRKSCHHKEALGVLFCLLDFPTWKEDCNTWKCLLKQVKKAVAQGYSDWIKEQWEPRQDWWPAFHFSKYRAHKDFEENNTNAYRKAQIAGILMGKGCKYFITIYQLGRKVQKAKLKKMRQYVKDHSLLQLSGC